MKIRYISLEEAERLGVLRELPYAVECAPTPTARPEEPNYLDTGCALHPSCLDCPEPVCLDEVKRGDREEEGHA